MLDSGFRGYRSFLGDVLPSNVQVRSFRHDGNLEAKESQHGIICGEVIHALAPDAEILFANWEADEPDTFLEAVRWARHEGAQIISCSVIMPSWSDGNGAGSVHRTLTQLLGDGHSEGDILCFASAGNTAERHWVGAFRPSTDGFHDWRAGITSNRVRPGVPIKFRWSYMHRREVLASRSAFAMLAAELCWEKLPLRVTENARLRSYGSTPNLRAVTLCACDV